MNQSKPKNNALQQVFQIVDQLSVEKLLELRQKLDAKTWGERFDRLVKQVAEGQWSQAAWLLSLPLLTWRPQVKGNTEGSSIP